MTGVTWRDLVKVHPAAESFREMTPEELADLADDIAKYEDLIHPIVVWRSAEDKPYELIDGRSRLDAMATLPDGEKRIRKALDRPIRKAAPACDPWKYVESVNDRRRHLMPEDRRERRERIARELRRDPQQSDRTIAKATGASPSTVGAERKEQEQIGVVSNLDTRIGKDGVAQPAHKPPMHRQPPAAIVHNTTPNPAAPLSKEQQLRAMREHPRTSAALVSNTAAPLMLARQIEDFCSGLKGRRTDVERIDRQLRLRLARDLLAALGIASAELVSAAAGGGGGAP